MADPTIVVRGRGDFSRLERDLARSQASMSKWGNRAKAAASVGLLAASAAATKFAASSVRAASDAQQSIGATETVYGKFASRVIRDSNRAAGAVGLSANEYRELANSLGAMLSASGMPLRRVTDLTGTLQRRAADLAATFGGTTREAVEAVGSALRGETDPIERYGVSIRETDIAARLAAKGQDSLTGAALKQAQQLARVDLILSQTAKSQGAFGRESDTLAGQQQRLAARFENLQARVGTMLLPVLTRLTRWASSEGVPALNRMVTWVQQNETRIASWGDTISSTVLPPLHLLGGGLRALLGFVESLPGPMQSLALQTTAAAVALPRLTTAVSNTTGPMQGMIANLRNAESRSRALGSTARGAAGVGGLLALTQSASSSNDAISTLGSIAGGALTGFSVGGPWGAAIGAGAGALMKLAGGAKASGDALSEAKPPAADFASTLRGLAGAATGATREMALMELRNRKVTEAARALGFTERELVDGILGTGAAGKRTAAELEALTRSLHGVNGAKAPFERGTPEWEEWRNNIHKVNNALGDLGYELERDRAEFIANQRAIAPLSKLYRGLARPVITAISQRGAPETTRQIAQLARRYDLTRREVRTVIRASGVETTERQVRRLVARIEDAARTRGELRHLAPDAKRSIDSAAREVQRGGQALKRFLEGSLRSTKAELPQLQPSLRSAAAGARPVASEGGRSVGDALQTGIVSGFAGTQERLAASAAAAVRAAVAAARAAARAKSPSRETYDVGRDLGKGLTLGLARQRGAARQGGRGLMASLLAGVDQGGQGVASALDRVTKLVEKRTKSPKREKAVLKSLRDEYRALQANGRAQDAITRKIEQQKTRLAELQQYVDSVRDSFVQFGNIAQLGRLEDGTVSTAGLLDQLRQRAAAADRFADLIRKLQGKLSKGALQQLIDAGPEAGLATAEAIAAGGQAAVTEINQLTNRLAAAGNSLGRDLTNTMFKTGISAAEGLLRGLESQQARLDRFAARLAKQLAAQVRKALGIKSPSRVFRAIGTDVMRGLDQGLPETHATRLGRRTASAVRDGFGTPGLSWGTSVGRRSVDQPQRIEIDLTISGKDLAILQAGYQINKTIESARVFGGLRSRAV